MSGWLSSSSKTDENKDKGGRPRVMSSRCERLSTPKRSGGPPALRQESLEGIRHANVTSPSSSMEVLDPGDMELADMCSIDSSSLTLFSRSKSRVTCMSPRSEAYANQHRAMTPTKKVALTAVRRKPEDSIVSFEPELDWRQLTQSRGCLEYGRWSPSPLKVSPLKDKNQSNGTEHRVTCTEVDPSLSHPDKPAFCESDNLKKEAKPCTPPAREQSEPKDNKDEGGESEDEESDLETDYDLEDEEEEKRRAPNELLMEFLDCVMSKDFVNAEKLCRMILIYEPDHKEALVFLPVIREKMALDAEDSDEDDSGEDDDDSDDEEDDEDGNTSFEDSTDESSSEDESEDESNSIRPDSGIGM